VALILRRNLVSGITVSGALDKANTVETGTHSERKTYCVATKHNPRET
jgi:hypothetical protein